MIMKLYLSRPPTIDVIHINKDTTIQQPTPSMNEKCEDLTILVIQFQHYNQMDDY